jgi:hypothetical protein
MELWYADECYRNYAKTHPDLCILAVNTFVQVNISLRLENNSKPTFRKLKDGYSRTNLGLRRP